ncbi:adenylate/guanylate cyclase domain-containing protein [Hydrogenophaga sp. 70-12]|uniref:adenylate/guanylate cyclase domain-containing protein n=1 Tax=Hydrogenophaga sp. 70-12 TaxID=1895769 RepID=UPI002580B39A|nr:adenylate/guanylate cyclase domain-containing protein [Hydrogenophaga sp. 70-12]
MQHKTVLVIDLVESVRLMAHNEEQVVRLWRGFVHHATTEVLPPHGGRLVKSLGDGLLAEFEHPAQAVRAAMALHRHFDSANQNLPAAQQLHLRAGLNATQLYIDDNDIYGQGVNLAARVADLAAPGETVVTASVYDAIVVGIDADVQDRGESYLKHWPEPVRTWTVTPVAAQGAVPRMPAPEAATSDFRPSIAVVPFETRSHVAEQFVIGDLLADGVITQLSRSPDLRVISRLSTSAFRGRQATAAEVGQRLEAAYTLSGSYVSYGDKVVINAELCDNRRGEVVWADRLAGEVMDLLQTESQLIHQLSEACSEALLHHMVQRTLVLPVPQLDSNALMLGGITLMHRSTPRDLQRSQQLLEAVVDRHKRVATPWAWLSKWHIMQVVQGLTAEPAHAFREAVSVADRALDLEPHSSLAMAIKGHALCHLGENIGESQRLLFSATDANPNDPMAWLYRCVWSTMWGNTADAIPEASRALELSPLDPQRYYFEMMLAASHLGAGELEKSIQHGERSLKKNRYHLPTIRTLMTAHYELGQIERAREMFGLVKQLQPSLTLATYLQTGTVSPTRQRTAKVLSALGLN